jgi:hypothetical protein
LRPIIGKESLVKSLGTGDYATASRRSTPYIAQFKTKLANARLGKQYHNNIKPRYFNGTDALSDSPEWFTPPIVFEAMAVEFDMDVASPGRDRVPWIPAREHLTRADDGLTAPWVGFVWLNPPYGLRNGMQKWIDRFVAHGNGVIMLPGYTYTRWFHAFVAEADCIQDTKHIFAGKYAELLGVLGNHCSRHLLSECNPRLIQLLTLPSGALIRVATSE